jgi:hypothetical protein
VADRLYCENCDAIPTRVTRVATVEGGHVDVMLCPACLAKVVLTDPDALWAVLTSGVKVAGPWERHPDGFAQRSLGRTGIVFVAEEDGRFYGTCGSGVKGFATPAEAEAWCDERLRADGYLLASGVTA